MFAFASVLLMLTIQVKPYRERSNQQLLSLSQINIFLCVAALTLHAVEYCSNVARPYTPAVAPPHSFLFTGLLLQCVPARMMCLRQVASLISVLR
jgi:hypothetical protein